MKIKKDNHNLRAKLDLRRHFLRKFHKETAADVLDCFRGEGVIWGQLQTEFKLAGYTGLDVRPLRGGLHMNSLEYLRGPSWQHDVFDLDAYGSPWKHYLRILARIQTPASVFLTIGCAGLGGQDREAMKMLGLPDVIPHGMQKGLNDMIIRHMLALPLARGYSIVESLEALNPGGTARYIGLRLKPVGSCARAGAAARRRR